MLNCFVHLANWHALVKYFTSRSNFFYEKCHEDTLVDTCSIIYIIYIIMY
jgi:hypothetical protein